MARPVVELGKPAVNGVDVAAMDAFKLALQARPLPAVAPKFGFLGALSFFRDLFLGAPGGIPTEARKAHEEQNDIDDFHTLNMAIEGY